MSYFLGIDLGTSSVKTLIMDARGNTLSVASETYGISILHPTWAEQDPLQWWQCTAKTIRRALAQADIDPVQIISVGFSGQMHGLVALDANNDPVRPAIIWVDQRSGGEAAEICETVGANRFFNITRNRSAAGFLLPSLYWLKLHEPKCYDKIKTVLLPKDYIRFRICGELGTDHTDASASLAFDTAHKTWSQPLLDSLGIAKEIFPKSHGSCEIAGQVTKQAELECGLTAGTSVVYGGGDLFMQSIGNGIVTSGVVASNIGTAAQIFTPTTSSLYDPEGRMQSYCYPIDGLWSLAAASLNGGICMNWFRKNFLSSESYADLDRLASRIPAGSENLIFLPYLAGERTPHMDTECRAVFFGMGLNHSIGHFIHSVMEGVVFALQDCMELIQQAGVETKSVIASGGGATSKLWLQIQADMFDQEIRTTNVKEQACCGAALTGAVGAGFYRDLTEACSQAISFSDEHIVPDAINHQIYREQYEVFKALYQANKEIFHRNGRKTSCSNTLTTLSPLN